MDHGKIGCDNVIWIEVPKNRVQWRAIMDKAISFRDP
jgi:hypothetical protein